MRIKTKNITHTMKKLRTRQHFIEDLGLNHIERQILYADCTLQRYLYDYGYDAFINTYNEIGELGNVFTSITVQKFRQLKNI